MKFHEIHLIETFFQILFSFEKLENWNLSSATPLETDEDGKDVDQSKKDGKLLSLYYYFLNFYFHF